MSRITTPGRIVKCTYMPLKDDWRDDLGLDLASPTPLWGVITAPPDHDGDIKIDILVADNEHREYILQEGGCTGWYLEPTIDKWRAVPTKQVPDHVWAALAKLRLTEGEGDSV